VAGGKKTTMRVTSVMVMAMAKVPETESSRIFFELRSFGSLLLDFPQIPCLPVARQTPHWRF